MYCKRCHIRMEEQKRSFHKQRKWTCPKCGRGRIIEGHRGFGCDRYREGCDFVIWKEVAGRRLTGADVRDLVLHGRTELIRGFTDPSGARRDARLRLDAGWKVVFDFSDPD